MYKLFASPVVASIAHTYKTAVLLYGIMTLPPSAFVSWFASKKGNHNTSLSYRRLLTAHRNELLAHARTAWTLLRSQSALCWPLIVAGVALVHGPPEDQAFVASSIRTIWLHPNAYCGPIVCLDKIQALWLSGKTGWEYCFDEPVPPVP